MLNPNDRWHRKSHCCEACERVLALHGRVFEQSNTLAVTELVHHDERESMDYEFEVRRVQMKESESFEEGSDVVKKVFALLLDNSALLEKEVEFERAKGRLSEGSYDLLLATAHWWVLEDSIQQEPDTGTRLARRLFSVETASRLALFVLGIHLSERIKN
ncbi:hypothetical protein BG000_005294 [Podila horticola]|nr:hypothetical protein BG000_005294 [Podila horticola]